MAFPALAFLANPAFWSGLGNAGAGMGAIGSGFLGGQANSGLEDADKQLVRASNEEDVTAKKFANQMTSFQMPYAQTATSTLNPLLLQTIQQRLQNPGLPAGLENSIWQLARQRIGQGYNNLGTQLGQLAASRGTLGSGAVANDWLNQVGLARNQAEQQFATDRGLANYNAMQQAIQEGMQLLGGSGAATQWAGTPSLGMIAQQPESTDYGALGRLFAQGLNSFGTKNTAGRTPGAQV